MTDAELIVIRDGFDRRVNDMFQAEAGKPLARAKKQPPLGHGRGNYIRAYAFSITQFAARCFYLNEQIDDANAALIETMQHYMDHPKDLHDRDNFHWHSEMLCRFIEFYGQTGSLHPGRLSAEAEDRILEALWIYANAYSRVVSCPDAGDGPKVPASTSPVLADATQTWHVRESENHHVQIFSTAWHFAKLAKDRPAYASRTYMDGHTAQAHYEAWTDYINAYCLERAKKGLFIEMANDGYNGVLLKGIYNFYDFAEDPTMKKRAGYLLDLYWATWAQEQIDGVSGGGKARIYQGGGDRVSGNRHVQQLAWFYLEMGRPYRISSPTLSALTSDYRLPLAVMDIALDTKGRGVYEIHQRPLGLVKTGYFRPPDYRMRTDYGGIHRYAYCAPEFIIGTPMLEARPLEDWAMISSQNRWRGVIFAGHKDARIVPQCEADDAKVTYNQQWSVQRKGTLIAQKLSTSTKSGAMRVWFSEPGLSNRIEEAGWVFVEAEGAYAAVRPAAGGYVWQPSEDAARGDWLRSNDEWAPVIVEVARKVAVADYAAFRNAVASNPLAVDGAVLRYTGLGGDAFTFYADYSRPPEINGTAVDYAPEYAFHSPFVQAEWNLGVVSIQKGERNITLDLNDTP